MPGVVKTLEHLKPRATSGPTSWTNGPYGYDGAGNIIAIGPESYVYDKVGRLKAATLRGPDLSSLQAQSFDYDAYGNLISMSKLGQTVLLPASALTNRLNTQHYDAAGNVDVIGTQSFDHDAVGMVNTVRLGTASPRIIYAYTADDERLFAFDVSTGITHWTLRGFDNKVLRDFKQQGSTWSLERDYVYRDGLLLAAMMPYGAAEHYSLDHLGTPRLVTDAAGHRIGYHVYWPFGEEWSLGTAQDGCPLEFTGHERDASPTGDSSSLDYMHARYYGAASGRFLSVDPARTSADVCTPQTWNRYSYAWNSPISYVDRDGRQVAPGQHYVIGQGWTSRSVLDPRNDPTPQMVMQFVAVTAAIGVAAGGPAILRAAFTWSLINPNQARQVADGLLSPPGSSTLPAVANPISGEFERVIETKAGSVGVLANASTEGTVLTLRDVAIYGADKTLNAGEAGAESSKPRSPILRHKRKRRDTRRSSSKVCAIPGRPPEPRRRNATS